MAVGGAQCITLSPCDQIRASRTWQANPVPQANGRHALEEVWDDLSAAWGPEVRREVRWQLYIRAGLV